MGYYMVQQSDDFGKKKTAYPSTHQVPGLLVVAVKLSLVEARLLLLGWLIRPSLLSTSHHISSTRSPTDAFFTSLPDSLQRALVRSSLAPLSSFTGSFLSLLPPANGAPVGRADKGAFSSPVLSLT